MEINVKELTPMMRHWYSVKSKHPEHLIAYRMGDFYEFFYEDAVKVSKLLGIMLGKRKLGKGTYPLAGVPHHAGNYLNNLVNMGQTVVLVEQLEDPATVKGRIVKRGVVRILSPGTVTEASMLKTSDNNYIASMIKERNGFGVSFADLSTGEFVATEFPSKMKDPLEKLLSIFSQYDPVEIIIQSEIKRDERLFMLLTDLTEAVIKTYDDYFFNHDEGYELIKRHFRVSNLKGFGLEDKPLAIQAAGGLLSFLKETQRDVIPNIFKISVIKEENILHLDYITQRNLELVNSLWEKGKDSTLFSVFNKTHTPMGSRLLKKVILQPLIDINEINQRLSIVQKFKDDIFIRSDLREELKTIGDLERFINRINYSNRVNARDLLNIKVSLERIPKIRELLEKAKIPEIMRFSEGINNHDDVQNLINATIREDPPVNIKEGNIIKDGYDKKVDDLRDILKNGKNYVLNYEEKQKKRWKLNTGLKTGHNNVLGYYIEITKNTLKNISKIPEEYVERQTLKNAKRYTTIELKDLEEKIVSAEDEIFGLEYEIFNIIREKVVKETKDILETARNIAIIDVLACFAEIAEKNGYCRPIIKDDAKIIIKEGRHPVVEQMNMSEKFISNDCYLDTETEQILIITGPNMAGKSTYLRQVALICLIAQMGSFVPARSATIGLVDQIFTRIGASDDLARKLSTFMIEMTETAKILNYATPRSLVIIDELGRGTSTSDGQSIAMATLERLHDLRTKTLFSTHYHQLTEINLDRVKNYHLDIVELDDGSINFVRNLSPGSTDKSYGIHVARLAGIPEEVIIRAFEILDQIEAKDPFKAIVKENGKVNGLKDLVVRKSPKRVSKGRKSVQTTFFKPVVKEKLIVNEDVKEFVDLFKDIDINSITPLDAMKRLEELKEKLNKLSM